jgi:hypothetical protein
MARDQRTANAPTRRRTALIIVKGEFGPVLTAVLPGAQIKADSGKTYITARVRDDAELYGVIQRLRDLGAAVLSMSIEP